MTKMFTASSDDLTRILNSAERSLNERDALRVRIDTALQHLSGAYLFLAQDHDAENPDSPLNPAQVALLAAMNALEGRDG